MRILFRGGSVAAGHGVSRGYVEIVKDVLAPRGIEVINRSRHRETSFDGVATFDTDIAAIRPDVLVLNFGIDDAFFPVYRSEFQENHVQIVRLARERFAPVIFLATSQTFDNPCDMDAISIYYRSLGIVAADLSCRLIPVHHAWAGYLLEKGLHSRDLCQKDDRYPNGEGHEVIAGAVCGFFSG